MADPSISPKKICLVVYLPLWKIWVRPLGLPFPIYGKTQPLHFAEISSSRIHWVPDTHWAPAHRSPFTSPSDSLKPHFQYSKWQWNGWNGGYHPLCSLFRITRNCGIFQIFRPNAEGCLRWLLLHHTTILQGRLNLRIPQHTCPGLGHQFQLEANKLLSIYLSNLT